MAACFFFFFIYLYYYHSILLLLYRPFARRELHYRIAALLSRECQNSRRSAAAMRHSTCVLYRTILKYPKGFATVLLCSTIVSRNVMHPLLESSSAMDWFFNA